MEKYYIAYVRGRSTCPVCGHMVEVDYQKMVTYSDIVGMATKGEG
jgi:hypothetical protein